MEWLPKAEGSLTRRCDNKKKLAERRPCVRLSLEDLVTVTQFVKEFKDLDKKFTSETRTSTTGKQDANSKTEAMYYPSHSKSKEPIPDKLLNGSFDIRDEDPTPLSSVASSAPGTEGDVLISLATERQEGDVDGDEDLSLAS